MSEIRVNTIDTKDNTSLSIQQNNTTALTIDTSQNVGIGTTSPSVTFDAEADGATVAHFNRTTSDGSVIELQKDGTTVGSIGTLSGNLFVGSLDTGIYFNNSVDSIYAINTTTNAGRDDAIDLGTSSVRFKDLYLSSSAYTPVVQGLGDEAGLTFGGAIVAPRKNNAAADGTVDLGISSARFKDFYLGGDIYLGGITSANALDDYEEGTFTVGFSGATISGANTTGLYTKIGRVVHWSYYSGASNISSASGFATITGLPFTVLNNNSAYSAVDIAHNTFFGGSATVGQQGYHQINTTTVKLNAIGVTATSTFVNGSTVYIMISGTYITG